MITAHDHGNCELCDALERKLEALTAHARKMLYAPSGEHICACHTAAERVQRTCWYCTLHEILNAQ